MDQNQNQTQTELKKIPVEAQQIPENQTTWEAPEYIRHEKGLVWFSIGAILILAIAIWGVFTNSWTMSVAFLLFGGVYYILHQEHPKLIQITLTGLGINVGARFYPYASIKYFWIIFSQNGPKTLHLKLANSTLSEVEIQLAQQNPAIVRDFLLKQIPEIEGKEESFFSIFSRVIKL